jgi:Tol biopolymer transport system component
MFHPLHRRSSLLLIVLLSAVTALTAPAPVTARGNSIGTTQLISVVDGQSGSGDEPQLTAGAKVVVFSSDGALLADDNDSLPDIYQFNTSSAVLTRVSGGFAPARRPAVSSDGLMIAFDSPAAVISDDSNSLHDVFVYDVKNQRTVLVSRSNNGIPGNLGSFSPAVSANGRYVAFDSNASNLVANDTNAVADVFIVDLLTNKIERVSVNDRQEQGNAASYEPAVSADGRFVAFHSSAANLVLADTNGVSDIFIHDRLTHTTERVSVSSFGGQANGGSFAAAVSADGAVVAFDSLATNLATGAAAAGADVLVHDRRSGITTLVSTAADGSPADGASFRPALSADGRVVAFSSQAANLVPADSNGQSDVFLHDLQTAATTRVSVRHSGGQADGASSAVAVSADGSFAAFVSFAANLVNGDSNGRADVYLHQLAFAPVPIGSVERASVNSAAGQANSGSFRAAISADGRVIAFDSAADNLVANDTNRQVDVFVRDLDNAVTSRISLSSNGAQANGGSYSPSVSADGRFVAFDSNAANLVSNDTNAAADVFVHDRLSGQTERVSISSNGSQGNNGSYAPSISADGRFVAFHALAANLVPDDNNGTFDVFVHDRQTGSTRLVSRASDGSPGNSGSYSAALSADGQTVAFDSNASNLVKDDTNGAADVFVHQLNDGVTERVSLTHLGTQANHASLEPSISADGNLIAFYSHAANLVEDDTNRVADVFVRDRAARSTKRVSLATGAEQGDGASQSPALARDGRYVVFTSDAANFSKSDTNRTSDVFLHDRESAVTTRISVGTDAEESNGWSGTASVADGAVLVAFDAAASNLSANDSNNAVDIFVRHAAPPTAFAPTAMLRLLLLPAVTP